MALSMVLRSTCRLQASSSPFISQVARLNTISNPSRILIASPLKQVAVQPKLIARTISVSAPKLSAATGNHSKLWTVERLVAAGLLAAVPAAIAFPSQPLDALLAVSIVMHSHWGLEAIVTDYVRPILFGNVVPKLTHGLLLAFSVATLAGLFYFIYNDCGIGKAVRKLWAVKSQ